MYSLDYIFSLKPKNKNKVDCLTEFIENYGRIIKEDIAKPIFSQTNQYDLFPKKKPYKKFRRNKNIWAPSIPKTDLERVKKTIKSILNKITEKNYNVLIETLICEINKFSIVEVLDILVEETINKVTYDISFHEIYIKICHRIWSMKKWHEELISIVEDEEGKLFWAKNSLKADEKLNGPFDNEEEIRKYTNKHINFRFYLLNAFEERFRSKSQYFDKKNNKSMSEEEKNKYRKKVFSLVQFLGKMYMKGYLSRKILYVLILDLIGYDKDEQPIEEYIESFSKLWKTIDGKFLVPIPKEHIYEIFLHISKMLSKYDWSIRIEFMMEDMINNYNKKYKDKIQIKEKIEKMEEEEEVEVEDIYDKIENIILEYKKKERLDEVISKLKKYKKNRLIILEIILGWAVEDIKNIKLSVDLIRRCEYLDILDIQNTLNSMISNIEEIKLDVPNVKNNMLKFITEYGEKDLSNFILLLE